ncbi:MAG: bifunctional (p)ppGpp synthetase/guanosine-3',5'-bis(diphosphate) 3'-pyrophosphohydrolase [Eubacterium sp.]|nr:bifunctional (p)ppGpp synthetase/guanosine-3',5'-bis(diphosphate) 3'-pyrophosphohydrolase [Eubacterium sp.]
MNTFEQAVQFALHAHEGQLRKAKPIPFILHPMEVAQIASTMTDDQDVLAAAVLHDVVEDTDRTADDILEHFGARIAYLVAMETEDKRRGQPASETWKIRKEESLAELKNSGDTDVQILWLSDKLSNLRSFYRSRLRIGDKMWEMFNNPDKSEQHWYYSQILELCSSQKDAYAYKEYQMLLKAIFLDGSLHVEFMETGSAFDEQR